MYYAPHILERKVVKEYDHDDNGNPVPGTGGEFWERLGRCKYRVVTDKIKIDAGDIVRVLNQDGSIRGSGVVINPMLTDYLNYGQIWLE